MSIIQILILAFIQGAAELLPVSSSAHVIVASKLMGLDPTSPQMTLLLVLLHTGTMFAVIIFFWKSWIKSFFSSWPAFWNAVKMVTIATFFTGTVGLSLKYIIEKFFLKHIPDAEIEHLFGNLFLISAALLSVGLFIIFAHFFSQRNAKTAKNTSKEIGAKESMWIGIVQGICLPFRGFSRSGATISTGLTLGVIKARAEEFSFALAVVLTPPVILREVLRLLKAEKAESFDISTLNALFTPGLIGMCLSFISGWIALRWLSNWLEHGKWHYFGIYCLFASIVVFILHSNGY
ncbi:MAG: undecaprenyl-diphosphate phosphatase [Spirochaetia bacterium]|nr:undecaprenyl-diphosphate phosphatase [Spirochaetia bacterium]